MIDPQKKPAFDDLMTLYHYDRLKNGAAVEYAHWHLKESLVDSFNGEEREMRARVRQAMEADAENLRRLRQTYLDTPWEIEKPVIWNDRARSGYYIENLEDSHKFEVYAESVFRKYGFDIGLYYGREEQYVRGETEAGIEIKCDKRSVETGNFYFEYQERLNESLPWTNSGLLKQDNTRFYFYGVVGNYSIFAREDLMELYREVVAENDPPAGCRKAEIGTSKGFVVPQSLLRSKRWTPSQVVRALRENGR